MTKRIFIPMLIMVAGVAGLGFTAWWISAIWIIAISGWFGLSVKEGMITGAVSLVLVWVGMALYMIYQDETQLIYKTGILFGGLSANGMVGVTGAIAIVTGLLSGWLGSVTGNLVRQKATNHRI